MGMTHIVVEGKVWWVRPRMRCRHKAHLGRASTLFECFAEVRLAVLCKFGGVCRLTVGLTTGGVEDASAWADMLGVGAFSRLVTTAIWRRATLSASLCLARRA